MPYEEDKILQDEFEEVEYKFKLISALLVPATFSMGGSEE